MTLTQKILAAHAVGLTRPYVQAGDVLRLRVDWTIASELAWNGMDKTYQALGRPKLPSRDRFFLAVDHTVDPTTLLRDTRTQKLVQLSRDFAGERRLRHFYDSNQTILHTRFYRELLQPGEFIEIYVNASLETCEKRDPKGLYKKARAGEIKGFTGIDDPYEAPEKPELVLDSNAKGIDDLAGEVIAYLKSGGYLSL